MDQVSRNQKKQTQAGLEEEADLLTQSATREIELCEKIGDLEAELRNLKSANARQCGENDTLANSLSDTQKSVEDLERERRELRGEVRDIKAREAQYLADYTELEEENIGLQKQLLQLKQSQVSLVFFSNFHVLLKIAGCLCFQVEFEALKHELKRFGEETDILHTQLEEMTRIKAITEKALEEALEALQMEREQKHAIRKELDHRLNSESMYQLSTLQHDLRTSAPEPPSPRVGFQASALLEC